MISFSTKQSLIEKNTGTQIIFYGRSRTYLEFSQVSFSKCVKPINIKWCDFYEVKQHLNITLVWCKLKLSRKAGKIKKIT